MTTAGAGHVLETSAYALEVSADGLRATLRSPGGDEWATLRTLAAFDTASAPDETLSVALPQVSGRTVEIERRSTVWERAGVRLVCGGDGLELQAFVEGRGSLTEVHLLGGRSLLPRRWTGFLPSGSAFHTLFSANPADPGRLVQPAAEAAAIGVTADSQPGRGHWFFTPAPLYFALTTAEYVADPAEQLEEGWLGIGLAAPVEELTFGQLAYVPADRAFSLRLDYEGHTAVDGRWDAPALILTPGLPDPYEGVRRQRRHLADRGAVTQPAERAQPDWWREPIFCGWGAQCALVRERGGIAADHATEENYDAFLEHLERHGVVPGTVVIDDKWQEAYGTCAPDRRKWPDLARWIAGRHDREQRVLLWWKAWDASGLPAELCIRNPDGAAVALDPTNPAARAELHRVVTSMLGPDGLDADGLKVDFTGSTPSGRALAAHGSAWGIALLHELLDVVYTAAKEAKPDALVITHTPHPSFTDVTDMLRLNDMLRLDDRGARPPVVPQMRHRAAIVGAACPGVPIDTDDWCVPDLESWRAYLRLKPELGVPALYYVDTLDLTGERFEDEDYDALRQVWTSWRRTRTEELV